MKKIILILSLVLLVAAIAYMFLFAHTPAQKIASILIITGMLFTASSMAKNIYGKRKKW